MTNNISVDCTVTQPSLEDLNSRLQNAVRHANNNIARFHQRRIPVACGIPVSIVGMAISPPAKNLFIAVLPICFGILVWMVFFQRSTRRIKLIYTVNESSERLRLGLVKTVKGLLPSSYAEIIEGLTQIRRKKVESNSSYTIHSHPFKVGSGKSLLGVSSNLLLPWIAGRTHIYLFSLHHFFVLSKRQVRAFRYSELEISVTSGLTTTHQAPRNARVVNRPWRYVNQDGTRDRRFKDNYQTYTFETTQLFIRNQSEQLLRLDSSRYGSFNDLIAAISALDGIHTGQQVSPNFGKGDQNHKLPRRDPDVAKPLPTHSKITSSRYLAGIAQYENSRDRIYFTRVDLAGDCIVVDVATDWGTFGRWSIDRLTLVREGDIFVARNFRTQQAGEQSEPSTLSLTTKPVGGSLAIRGSWTELGEHHEFSGVLEIQK